jgi:hypothetical protein
LKQSVANGSLKIEIFIVVFVIIDFFDGPFTVASAVFGFNPDPLMVAFPVIFQTNYFDEFSKIKIVEFCFDIIFFFIFLFFDQIRPSVLQDQNYFPKSDQWKSYLFL